MNKYFLEYSKTKFDELKLIDQRKLLNFANEEWFKYTFDNLKNLDKLDKYLKNNIKSIFPEFKNNDVEIVYRFHNNNNYNLKWHIDNCIFQRHAIKNIEFLHDLEIIGRDYKYVYCIWKHRKIPIYTMIIYLSNYMTDFQGGELEFIDGLIIKPKLGDVIIFNSNEIHRVHTLKSGKRNCIVIKFY